jgi:hypothetical protein
VRFAAIALALAATASAQVTAPLLGWLPEGTQIRPINGLPAAATLGAPANVGHALQRVAVSPSQNYVLASDANTGAVLLIADGTSATPINTPIKPDQVVASPRGSAAALWYAAAAQFETLTGLPATPAIRTIDASVSSAPLAAIAVSDDGQWIAAASSSGVYEWGPDGAPHQLYSGSDAGALAFFAGNSNLLIATSTQILSIAGSATSVLDQGTFSPVGLATSLDNQEVVLANQNGTVYSIETATGTPSVRDCQCSPSGAFGLGGAVFRLTSASTGGVKLFDAAAGVILAVPGDPPRRLEPRRPTGGRVQAQVTATFPTLAISLNPTPTGYLQQPAMTVTASSAYASDIEGNIVLTFASSSTTGGLDQAIQFSTGGKIVNFTIPAGATQANFSGASSVTFSTGTTAGIITLTANVSAPASVAAAATQTVTNKPTWPTISNVQLNHTSGGVTVVVTGYSPTDDVIDGVFNFALSSNATITVNNIGVALSPVFQAWYGSATSYATGGEFMLSVPFAVSGNNADMVGVTVTLLNSVAESNPTSSQ